MNKFVIGDMHGGHKALLQCLERSGFNKEKDQLICLGDVADGWPEVTECFEELLSMKNLIFVRGNHDNWLLDYLRTEETPDIWITQGGKNSFLSYNKRPDLKEKHRDFLMSTPYYYLDEEKRLFVHGGLNLAYPFHEQTAEDLMWSRDIYNLWRNGNAPIHIPGFKEVYLGHSSVGKYIERPVFSGNVIFMDTGGGWEGVLSIYNMTTGQIDISDPVRDLYPDIRPR